MTPRRCIVCNIDVSRDAGRCTNCCCSSCHAQFCTPGGATYPGHGIDVKAAKAKLAAFRRGKPKEAP